MANAEDVEMEDNEEDDENFLHCKLCDLNFSGLKPYEQHINGNKHRKKEMRKKAKLRKKSEKEHNGDTEVQNVGQDTQNDENSADSDGSADKMTCEICNVTCSGIIPYKQHLKSMPHKREVKRKKLEEEMNKSQHEGNQEENLGGDSDSDDLDVKPYADCQVCEKEFNGPESYQMHMKSEKHRKKLKDKKMIEKLRRNRNPNAGGSKSCKAESESGSENSDEEQNADDISSAAKLLKSKLSVSPNSDASDSEKSELFCEECNKPLSGLQPLKEHLLSKSHLRKINKNKLMKKVGMSSDQEEKEYEENDEVTSRDVEEVLTCSICHMAFSGPESKLAHLKSKGHIRKRHLKEMKKKYPDSQGIPTSKTRQIKSPPNAGGHKSENDDPTTSPKVTEETPENMQSQEVIKNMQKDAHPHTSSSDSKENETVENLDANEIVENLNRNKAIENSDISTDDELDMTDGREENENQRRKRASSVRVVVVEAVKDLYNIKKQ